VAGVEGALFSTIEPCYFVPEFGILYDPLILGPGFLTGIAVHLSGSRFA
jgi:hypothetical protein